MLGNKACEIKFADFIRLCGEAKASKPKVVLINNPEALGNDYGEMVESLNRLSDAELQLAIVPRAERANTTA